MPLKRTYGELGDACRAANALDLVGDKWSLIAIRELILSPKRFADLQEAVRGITPAMLTERLRSLQDAGIVEQTTLGRGRAYRLTAWGQGLETVLQSLGRWFSSGPNPVTAGGMTPDAIVLAMRTMAAAAPARMPPVALRLYDGRLTRRVLHDYQIASSRGVLAATAGTPRVPAATVTAETMTWGGILFGGLQLSRAEKQGRIRVEGDRDAVTLLIGLFTSSSAP
jgi:DNA-binding HxlR family transcriptional regulator